MPYFSTHESYESPFAQKKVLLNERQLEESEKRSAVAVVSNTCAAKFCANSENRSLLSCFLFNGQERNPGLLMQMYHFNLSSTLSVEGLERQVHDDKCTVGIANENKYASTSYNDTYYTNNQNNYLRTVNFETSLSIFKPANLLPVKVAVIDTGVGLHPDLGDANAIPGIIYKEDMRSYASKSASECVGQTYTNDAPNNTHGTFVSGIIGAKLNNSLGIAGVASNAKILSFTVGDCKGRMSTTEIGNALLASLQNEAEVVNLSLGGSTNDDPALRFALISLLNRKTVVVVAAGNNYKDLRTNFSYPASYAAQYQGIITVGWGTVDGEVQKGDQLTWGSNYSPEHIKILAPGDSIASTMSPAAAAGYTSLASGYGLGRGSSFAAPLVTGAVALSIGYMKKYNLLFDERMVEYLVTDRGATKLASLNSHIKNGSRLDLGKLSTTLKYLVDSGITPQPVTISNKAMTYNPTSKAAEASFTTTWDLTATHYGARLGVFDSGCGFSAPCLIQDFELSGNSGSKRITLTRNETLPMLASPADPDFNVYAIVAIYYKVPNPTNPKKFLNNFGTDALQRVNLRDFDMSTPSSKFMGEVTNLRTDQKYFYIQGSSCLEGSNKAVVVDILNEDGTVQPSDFSYSYDLMVPHSGIFDALGYYPGAYTATNYKMNLMQRNAYKAGLEANPLIITSCKALTTAHGFEFGVPLEVITSSSLAGKKFSIRAKHPSTGAILTLKDSFGQTSFSYPEVNYQTKLASQIRVERETDGFTATGYLCSQSPTPIHVEISFNHWDYRCRLKQVSGFPNFSEECKLGLQKGLPNLYDPSLATRDLFHFYTYDPAEQPNGVKVFTDKVFDLTDVDYLQKHIAAFPVLWPNASVASIGSSKDVVNKAFYDAVLSRNLRDVASGLRIKSYQEEDVLYTNQAPEFNNLHKDYLKNRAGTAVLLYSDWLGNYWDWYDVGEDYTPSVVAYKIDTSTTTGEYLFRTFRVSKIMREVKKYETPIGGHSKFLGEAPLTMVSGDSSCKYKFTLNKNISSISQNLPSVYAWIRGFIREDENLMQVANIDNPATAIKTVPIDLRFFQDGVMIQHLVSDFGSNTYIIPTLGRSK